MSTSHRFEVGLLDESNEPIDCFDWFKSLNSAKLFSKRKFDINQKPVYILDRMAHFGKPEMRKYDGEWQVISHRQKEESK